MLNKMLWLFLSDTLPEFFQLVDQYLANIQQESLSPTRNRRCRIWCGAFGKGTVSFTLSLLLSKYTAVIVNVFMLFSQGLEGMDASSVREAIKTWQDNYIHVQAVMDEFVTLRERTKYLRDEVGNCTRRSVITNDSLQMKKVRKWFDSVGP